MAQVGARALRSVALLTSGVLAVSVLAGCSSDEEASSARAVPADIAAASRAQVEDGGTLRWAIDALPTTLNAFQADADATTARITGAVLPALFTLDERGRPQVNGDYLESAEVVEQKPKQVVRYKLRQQAVWSDGREIGAPDFVAQWRALSGRNTAYWTARNAGYERIEKIERGASDLEVRVTFAKPYADWKALFTPLYPKEVMGSPDTFNDGARTRLAKSAGPFRLKTVDAKAGTVTLVRDARWWGEPAKLDSLVLRVVPRDRRAEALIAKTVDLAAVDPAVAQRVTKAGKPSKADKTGKAAPGGAPATGAATPPAQGAPAQAPAAQAALSAEQSALRGYVVRRTLEPAYTQLALNGASGPLADERVRRAIARAVDRQELAKAVLAPLGLPADPVGSHLALAGQDAYADSSGALGSQDTEEALALLADAGWTKAGARRTAAPKAGTKAGAEASAAPSGAASPAAASHASPTAASRAVGAAARAADVPSDEGLYIVGDDKADPEGRPGTHVLAPAPAAAVHSSLVLAQARALTGALTETDSDTGAAGKSPAAGKSAAAKATPSAGKSADAKETADAKEAAGAGKAPAVDAPGPQRPEAQGGAPGAYAPVGTAAPAKNPADPARPAAGPLGKDGRPLTLRFVLPSGPGSEVLRTVGERISRMLDRIGVRTEISKVPDENFFKDHIASGDYDLALYSWPGTAFPATDGRPIFAKPEPATDGSLLVEQNYTRVGTDHIDQLFDQAAAELDEKAARDLVRRADARIWAAAGSIPLFQRPELVAVRKDVVNAGAFGFATPRYENVGFAARKAG
ncbi:ABC transporter family substrate-binding protein [Streptomyces sp. DH12]|uniref:ABC transporter family substrate-binding protein n=1 Tax=Streptomyces sp. DH12 TaxID=2857010 RepID=UPI001E3B1DD7|nr:ABC transporter family substrate-binding protein [Streptomyces sp. DH12]